MQKRITHPTKPLPRTRKWRAINSLQPRGIPKGEPQLKASEIVNVQRVEKKGRLVPLEYNENGSVKRWVYVVD